MICNDVWYVEPARILATSGATMILVPAHGGHCGDPEIAASMRERGTNLAVARAVENGVWVVVADVAGQQGDHCSTGSTAIIDPDGRVVAQHDHSTDGVLITDIEAERRPSDDPRGFDGHINSAVTDAFLHLWQAPAEAPPTRLSAERSK